MGTSSITISQANAWRRETTLTIVKALAVGGKPDMTPLALNASVPSEQGFSNADLEYSSAYYVARLPEYEALRHEAMTFVGSINTRAQRDGGRISAEDRARRDAALNDAAWACSRIKAVTTFSNTVDSIIETRAQEAEAHCVERFVAVMQAEPIRIVRVKKAAVKKVAVSRGEITLKGFGDLKEHVENTAMILNA